MTPAFTLVSLFQSSRPGERLLPLGALWLRAACEARGIGVDLRDLQFLDAADFHDPDAVVRALGDTHPIVAIGCMTDLLPLAIAVVERLKSADPQRIIVLGGWGPGMVAGALVDAFPFVDLVVRGEGDVTLPELVLALASGGSPVEVAGVDGRWRGARFHTPDRAPVADIGALAEPRTDDLDLTRYSYYTTVTARGCPYTCGFCEIPTQETRRVRSRPVDRVVAELVAAHDRGVDFVGIQDDIFLLHRPRVDALLDGLVSAGVRMRFSGFARVNTVDAAWLARLGERGLDQVTFGVEAGSDNVLRAAAKAIRVHTAFSTLAAAVRVVSTRCYFLWGFPTETFDDFLGTAHAAFYAEQMGVRVEVGHLAPLPGSPLALAHARRAGSLELHRRYPFSRILQPPDNPELFALIERHPAIFAAFYAFPTLDRDRKWAVAAGLRARSQGG